MANLSNPLLAKLHTPLAHSVARYTVQSPGRCFCIKVCFQLQALKVHLQQRQTALLRRSAYCMRFYCMTSTSYLNQLP